MRKYKQITLPALALLLVMISACSSNPPENTRDACAIFNEKDDWYKASLDAYKKWGAPIHVQLAIIHQESRFQEDAAPPRQKLFWFIPWFRSSSAYGYAQAMDATWDWYQEETGNHWADRDDFDDAVDFIAWYINYSNKKLGISKWDAYRQYLAYHEGHGGYRRGSYKKKTALKKIARKVERNAKHYRAQLVQCQDKLDRGWSLWPF